MKPLWFNGQEGIGQPGVLKYAWPFCRKFAVNFVVPLDFSGFSGQEGGVAPVQQLPNKTFYSCRYCADIPHIPPTSITSVQALV